MAKTATAQTTGKHRFSQFLPFPLWRRVKRHAKDTGSSVTQVIEETVAKRFSKKAAKA